MVSISKTQIALNYQYILPETSYETLLQGFTIIHSRLHIDTSLFPIMLWK